ncbi:MAG: hypothetical protein JNM99_23410 [Verrucomicrobiaceae bacterium]|nr:hypothetical protein [Verrucomicrobiaceae bacterium]
MNGYHLALSIVIAMASLRAGELFDESKAVTLFAFDNVAIPHTQNLRLEMRQPERHPMNPVLQRGEPGSPDAHGVQFYGSIIKDGARYRMWYVAFDDEVRSKAPSTRWRAAYAESTDGVHWVKPRLGLVEFRGSKENNLVDVDGDWGFVNLKVIKDEADPDPSRRYKMVTHVYFRHHTRLGTLLPFVSVDGLRWRPVKEVKPLKGELRREDLLVPGFHLEPACGLYQWGGQYVLTAQNAMPSTYHYQGRVVRLHRSADFVNWSATSTLAFVRTAQFEYLGAGRSREGEQNHEGIAVWNRGNVLLGISGRWHGAAEWKDVSVDLGLVLSNDGENFREPLHEWTFLERGKDGEWDQGGVIQGQGFENIGEQTFVYYGAWDPRATGGPEVKRGGVGIAMLPRDRFGDLRVDLSNEGPGDYQLPRVTAELITAAIPITRPRFFVNAVGLGEQAELQVELLDAREQPIPGSETLVRQSGFQVPIEMAPHLKLPDKVRLRLVFDGEKRSDIRLSAIYIAEGQ